jgi:class 3 adenylate cyclase
LATDAWGELVDLHDRLRDSGVEILAGIHTGEVQLRGDDVGGIGVHVAAGSDYVLEDRGPYALKGVGGEWRLFAVRA